MKILKFFIYFIFFWSVIRSEGDGVADPTKKKDEASPIEVPRPVEQNTIIQTQNAYHHNEDLSNEIIERKNRRFLVDSISDIIDNLEKRVSRIEQTYQNKLNKVQQAIEILAENDKSLI